MKNKPLERDAKRNAKRLTNKLYTIYAFFAVAAYSIVALAWPYLLALGAPGNIYRIALVFFAFLWMYNLRFVSKIRFERDRYRVMAGEVPEEHHHGHSHN
ncbi:MAG: hypothetical protein HZB68_00850 [Candidatus Aenigmarchaeota archaeon]|nr:hypothetical protein [Candidatus Aenigmarchaeota archaeon]